jgi:predicted branched-subunit amino acid permease
MKRTIGLVLLFVFLVPASDVLRAVLETQLWSAYDSRLGEQSRWQPWFPKPDVAVALLYWVVFAVAGALFASRVSRPSLGMTLAFLLGLAVPFIGLFFEAPRPLLYEIDRDFWTTLALGWVHWYVPPLAAATGALAWSLATKRFRKGPHGT